MALDNFVEHFMERYEDRFFKENVASKIANFRTEPMLKYGDTVTRFTFDTSVIRTRTVVDGVDRTIDALSDGEEQMLINVKVGGAFSLPKSQRVQA